MSDSQWSPTTSRYDGALFRRDYGGMFTALFPELTLRESGFLGKNAGWDDVTWWLFERS